MANEQSLMVRGSQRRKVKRNIADEIDVESEAFYRLPVTKLHAPLVTGYREAPRSRNRIWPIRKMLRLGQ